MDDLKAQLDVAGWKDAIVNIIRKNSNNFGDLIAEISYENRLIRVVRDRGQYYVEIYDQCIKKFIRPEQENSKLMEIYRKGSWQLSELLSEMEKSWKLQ